MQGAEQEGGCCANGGENRFVFLNFLEEEVYFNQNFNKISEGYIQHRILEPQWFIFGSAISN